MCLVTPFTLPCCRRLYVSVKKLPSCPDDWPRKKCPEELIVQISGHQMKDADHRPQGICWRCLADRRGITGKARAAMRPALDRAFIVAGLESWSVDEKREKMETAGLCWHCGADRACGTCGSGRVAVEAKEDTPIKAGTKRGRADAGVGADKGKGVNKRMKIEKRGSGPATPSMTSAPLADPALQHYGYNTASYGRSSSYDHSTQIAPNFDYHPQKVQFASQSPTVYPSSNWHESPIHENQDGYDQGLGTGLIDPALYQLQEEQLAQQNFNIPLRTHEQSPLANQNFEENPDHFRDPKTETMSPLYNEYGEDGKSGDEDEDEMHILNATSDAQLEAFLDSTEYQYP